MRADVMYKTELTHRRKLLRSNAGNAAYRKSAGS